MPYLTAAEINTHLYGEVVAEIERQTPASPLLDTAIKAAIAEVKGYLSAYDKAAIFDATGDDRNPIILLYTKDVAVWHYIQLANPDVDYEQRKERYELAIDYLEKVQSGKAVPELPVPTVEGTAEGEGFIKFGSNPKRNNYYN
jgi:phage gp36-like protein